MVDVPNVALIWLPKAEMSEQQSSGEVTSLQRYTHHFFLSLNQRRLKSPDHFIRPRPAPTGATKSFLRLFHICSSTSWDVNVEFPSRRLHGQIMRCLQKSCRNHLNPEHDEGNSSLFLWMFQVSEEDCGDDGDDLGPCKPSLPPWWNTSAQAITSVSAEEDAPGNHSASSALSLCSSASPHLF